MTVRMFLLNACSKTKRLKRSIARLLLPTRYLSEIAERERERERERIQDTRSNWWPSRHDTPTYHSVKRTLIDPGNISSSRMQAYGCRACAGVFGSGEVNLTLTSPLSDPTRITIRINRAPEGTLDSM